VVVPDGLAASADGTALPEPSFLYRQVLDHVAGWSLKGWEILLAPGNRFGGATLEQEAACRYLRQRAPDARVRFPRCADATYVDTYANAAVLRAYLQQRGRWPAGPVDLVCARRHSVRAELCFRRLGYRIRRVHRVACRIPSGARIVSRLWYYKHPFVHAAYELLAILRELLRGLRGDTVRPWRPIW
jgi:hypothetical protein